MHLVEELNGSTAKARYLRGAGLVAQLIDSNTFYYLFNSHGDVVQRADQSGNLSTLYDYDAFGNNTRRYNVGYQPTDGLDTDPNPFRYCGEYFDVELGEIYLRNRCYAPGTGRFSSEDPIRDGKNWYGYCGGNPVAFKDPLGLKDPDVWYGNEKSLNERKREQSKMGKGGNHSDISSPDYWNNQQYFYDNNVYTPTPPASPPAPVTPSGGNHSPDVPASTPDHTAISSPDYWLNQAYITQNRNNDVGFAIGDLSAFYGEPNSRVPVFDKRGNVNGYRQFDPNGRAWYDYHNDDHGNPKRHVHDETGGHYNVWDWSSGYPESDGSQLEPPELSNENKDETIPDELVETAMGVAAGAAIAYVGWQIIKWVIAIIVAAPSSGISLGIAAALP